MAGSEQLERLPTSHFQVDGGGVVGVCVDMTRELQVRLCCVDSFCTFGWVVVWLGIGVE